MFNTRRQAAEQLLQRLKNDRVGERPTKIIHLTENGKPIAEYLNKNLNLSSINHRPSTIIITDDGNISLSKLLGKIHALREKNAKQILVAIPVYEHEKVRKLEKFADGVYVLKQPKVFMSADEFYK